MVDIQPTKDEFPRDFNITPDDNFVVCAHQEGESKVTVFKEIVSQENLNLLMTTKVHLKVFASYSK